MADIEITVGGGTSKRLLTAGKYCDKNILVTSTGGGGEPGLRIVSGSFTPAENTQQYTVQHNLGAIPRIICVFNLSETDFLAPYNNPNVRFMLESDLFRGLIAAEVTTQSRFYRSLVKEFPENDKISEVTESVVTFGGPNTNQNYFAFKASNEYFWFVVG